ncbi:MAG: glycerophosphodiester phosphodiesterase [Rickettsiales bacterium]|nr:glycerophosphodiester phosphodiesterase [Rickettsiales bacterium]
MKILGHRGIRQDENINKPYQNTIEAINFAIKNNADGVEIDVFASLDKICFVIHDDEIKIHNGGDIKITSSNSKIIDLQRIGKPNNIYKIPKLSELFEYFSVRKNKILNIEIKQNGISELVYKEIKNSKILKDNLIISSFNHSDLISFRQLDKNIKIGLLFTSDDAEKEGYFEYIENLSDKLGNTIFIPNCYTKNEKILNSEREKYFWTIKEKEIENGLFDSLKKLPNANFITDFPELIKR